MHSSTGIGLKGRMLIVEGPDNSGKTTLCRTMSSRFLRGELHSPGPHPERNERWQEWVNWTLWNPSLHKLVIFDRYSLISEAVYGPIFRGGNSLAKSLGQLRFRNEEGHIIWCMPSLSSVLDFGEREQMTGVMSKGEEIYKGYEILIDQMRTTHPYFTHVIYNWKSDNGEELMERLEQDGY